MPKITFIDTEGTARTIDAELGATVMETAMANDVPGLIASCGGSCTCATCHVYVEEEWIERVGKPAAEEEDMLYYSAIDPQPNSRLSCQIKVTEELDGLTVRTPRTQM